MTRIHVVHRRLAELTIKSQYVGGYDKLSRSEQQEINHCLKVNANLVERLDRLKNLSMLAHETDDSDWLHELCEQIDEIEKTLK